MPKEKRDDDLLTVGMAAVLLGKSPSTIRNWCDNKTIAFERVEGTHPKGDDRLIRRFAVMELKAQLEKSSRDAASAAKENQ